MKTTYGKRRNRDRDARKKTESWRQLAQLLVCLAVFLVVFIGKEVWPSKVAETGKQLLSVIRANTDFRAAFADLGRALSREESVLGEFGEFCVSVFAQTPEELTDPPALSDSGGGQEPAPADTSPEQLSDTTDYAPRQETQMLATEQTGYETDLQVGDIVQNVDYQDEELPEGFSAQWLYLGEMEMVTPVQGTVTSQFGYRDHPTIGRYAAHGGVDIAADNGTEVAAFSDGTVESVGNSEDFGLWLQLAHPNDVTTFYSHCSKICVEKGEQVRAGQTVALVGSTGNSTGPHLHFEIKLDSLRLNPMHYIELSRIV